MKMWRAVIERARSAWRDAVIIKMTVILSASGFLFDWPLMLGPVALWYVVSVFIWFWRMRRNWEWVYCDSSHQIRGGLSYFGRGSSRLIFRWSGFRSLDWLIISRHWRGLEIIYAFGRIGVRIESNSPGLYVDLLEIHLPGAFCLDNRVRLGRVKFGGAV